MARTWHDVWRMEGTRGAAAAVAPHPLTDLATIEHPRPSPPHHRHPPHHPPSSSSLHVLSREPQVREAPFSLKDQRAGRSLDLDVWLSPATH